MTTPAHPMPDDERGPAERPTLTPVPAGNDTDRRATDRAAPRNGGSRGWTARWMVNVTWPWFVGLAALDGLLLALISVADLFFVKGTLDPLIGQAEFFSWAVATTVALLSVVAAVQAGRYTRKYRATGHDRGVALGLLVAWAALGVGLFVMRWIAGDLTTHVVFDGGTATNESATHHLMALVLATVHLATGATAFLSGYALTNPEGFALRTARQMHRKVLRLLPETEATYTRLATNLGARLSEMAEAREAAETAKAVRRAVAAHVQAVARARIAQHLGSPEGTGVARSRPDDLLPPGRAA